MHPKTNLRWLIRKDDEACYLTQKGGWTHHVEKAHPFCWNELPPTLQGGGRSYIQTGKKEPIFIHRKMVEINEINI